MNVFELLAFNSFTSYLIILYINSLITHGLCVRRGSLLFFIYLFWVQCLYSTLAKAWGNADVIRTLHMERLWAREKERWLGERIFGPCQRCDHLGEEWDLHLTWTLSTQKREIVTLFGQMLWNPSLSLVMLVLDNCWGHVHHFQCLWCPFPCPRIAHHVVAGSLFTPLYWPWHAYSLSSSHYTVQQLY